MDLLQKNKEYTALLHTRTCGTVEEINIINTDTYVSSEIGQVLVGRMISTGDNVNRFEQSDCKW